MTERLYSTAEIGKMLGVTYRQAQTYIKRSGLPVSVKTTRRLKMNAEQINELKKWLANKLIQQYHLEDVVTIKN